MPATYTDLFDNNTTHITSVIYSSTAKKLEITFSSDLTGTQAAGAVMQSINNFLVDNTDLTVNLSSSSPTRNTSSRNGVPKDQINFNFQIYTPPSTITFDPKDL